jgi:hypothetical protein
LFSERDGGRRIRPRRRHRHHLGEGVRLQSPKQRDRGPDRQRDAVERPQRPGHRRQQAGRAEDHLGAEHVRGQAAEEPPPEDHQNRDMRPDARSHVLEPGQGLGEGRKGQQPGAVRRRPRGGLGALHLAGQQVRPGLPGHAARPAITSSGLHRLRSGHHLLDGQK